VNRAPENRGLLAGIITSGSENAIEFADDLNMPILFLHHERDGCTNTQYHSAQTNFEKTKSRNKGITEFATVKGGQAQGNPCRDGLHMYFGAHEAAARLIEQFVARNTRAGTGK